MRAILHLGKSTRNPVAHSVCLGRLTRPRWPDRPRLVAVLYEVFLARGGPEPRVVIEDGRTLKAGDFIHYELETYGVASVVEGHDEFDGVVFAEWVGEVGPGEIRAV